MTNLTDGSLDSILNEYLTNNFRYISSPHSFLTTYSNWLILSPVDEVSPRSRSASRICGKGTGMYFQKGDFKEIDRSPLAKIILSLTGVKSIFLGRDFITVTKGTEEAW